MLGLLHLSLKPVLPCLASPDILNADALIVEGPQRGHDDPGSADRELLTHAVRPWRTRDIVGDGSGGNRDEINGSLGGQGKAGQGQRRQAEFAIVCETDFFEHGLELGE